MGESNAQLRSTLKSFNSLTPDSTSCPSPGCFRAKIDACAKKTRETKPQLVQLSAAWNSREGAPLGGNQDLELEIRKPKTNARRAVRQAQARLSATLVRTDPIEALAEVGNDGGGAPGRLRRHVDFGGSR